MLRKAFDEAVVVECLLTGKCSVFPMDAEIVKLGCNWGFINEEGEEVVLAGSVDRFAKTIVASVTGLGFYFDRRHEQSVVVYKGKSWKVEELFFFLCKLEDFEREDFLRKESEDFVGIKGFCIGFVEDELEGANLSKVWENLAKALEVAKTPFNWQKAYKEAEDKLKALEAKKMAKFKVLKPCQLREGGLYGFKGHKSERFESGGGKISFCKGYLAVVGGKVIPMFYNGGGTLYFVALNSIRFPKL